ncbi:histidine phosphatase family protein [Nocardioides mangrovi]|uniref:Phosphoglycerate mutase family protein n=1 Tax=Nocardioides mangrovi TaxID=2874580 RepID=A0ABS7U7R1_9ACTN|nr:histidine phosphatase family protein [Nocardioides mangrovi]MBZ5737019.1 phosphoglycerate mutase family protein [Nocardioides mangrovi]
MLYLVRHGRPLVEEGLLPAAWELDPAGFDDVWALRESGRLPTRALWFTSPEPKAIATAQLLTEADVGVVDALREQVRDTADWISDLPAVVRRALAEPGLSAHPGWEPIEVTRTRVVGAVRTLLAEHRGSDLVLVGHGTAWTVLVADLTGTAPDLDRWRTLAMPDVIEVDV